MLTSDWWSPPMVRGIQRQQQLPSRYRCTWTRRRTPCSQENTGGDSWRHVLITSYVLFTNGEHWSCGWDEPLSSASELVEQRHHLSSSGAAQRMTQSDGSSVRIHLLQRDSQLLHTVHRLSSSKGSVQPHHTVKQQETCSHVEVVFISTSSQQSLWLWMIHNMSTVVSLDSQ